MSSLPNALVATQVNSAESLRSSFLILKSDNTPVGRISSRMVYLQQFGQFCQFSFKFIQGRLVGIGIALLFPTANIDPGKYALIGAAATLGGILR